MIRIFILLLLSNIILLSAQVENFRWKTGETYLEFLEKNKLPLRALYYNLDEDEQTFTEEIRSGVNSQILRGDNDKIDQILIPMNDELQLHIYSENGSYKFETIPIISDTITKAFVLEIKHSPYYDIIKATGSKKLAQIFVAGFKNSLNFKRDLREGDILAIIYEQKYRLGKPFSMPTLKVSMIEMKKKRHYIYLNTDDRYYDKKGHEVEGFLLARPVKYARISSRFTKRRFHPILKKYRAHLGIDYAARRGTPIVAAASGYIIYAGRNRGYGKVIKIRHPDGYMTLYAHQKSFRRGMRKGKYVKKGQTIGYVGSTGLSTGPHLHFSLYKHGRAINPEKVVQVTTKKLRGKDKKKFALLRDKYNKTVEYCIEKNINYVKAKEIENICYFYNEKPKKDLDTNE